MGKIIVARHGETAYNGHGTVSAEVIKGWLDVPLNQHGRKEAGRLRDALKPYDLMIGYSSTLKRAKDTLCTIMSVHHKPAIAMNVLKPWNLGDLQGKHVKDVLSKLQGYIAAPEQKVPNGESLRDFQTRFLTALKLLMEKADETIGDILLVGHTQNLQAIRAWADQGFDPALKTNDRIMGDYTHEIQPGEYVTLKRYGFTWTLERRSSERS